MKKLLIILISLSIILILGLFLYYYYIKPQKEYLTASAEQCIDVAMKKINTEVEKKLPNPYVTREEFIVLIKKQSMDTKKCLEKYDNIIFSTSERSLYELNLNVRINNQSDKIKKYIDDIEQKIASDKKAQDEKIAAANKLKLEQLAQAQQRELFINSCKEMKKSYDGYQDCVKNEVQVKNNPFYSSTEYITAQFSPYNKENNTDSKDTCLQKNNYKKFGYSMMDCIMYWY